ncbi:T9SS type A sorting domain-containing protein [Kaistella palustris]|uniref:T9SS type A sorting domain-containing protein n=1 Tax=Kaistella palustris TaxID=493376 RepID=UPI0003FA8A1F|nr:T9SS type A sorting domain-containing protein [Kaistella palustris]
MKKFTFFLFILCGIQIFPQITLSRDNSFATGGTFTTGFTAGETVLQSNVLVLPDNAILFLINTSIKSYILKLRPNGKLDTTFGNNGRLQFDQNNFVNALLQGEKIIVCFGPKPSDYNTYEDSKILRFNSNGSPDLTFGNSGVINEVTESTNPQSLSVLVLDDRSLVVSNSNSTNAKKYTADGKLDTGYAGNGEIQYDYHFPLGQSANGKIATCDVNSLSSSVFSFYHINALNAHTVLDLNDKICHQYNGVTLQNKTNVSTRMTNEGLVYSVFEYKNYPLPDFSRLVVIRNEQLDSGFNGSGFVSSANYEQFLDTGFTDNSFFVLKQKDDQKSISAYSTSGNSLMINSRSDFKLLSGHEIEVKDNYILVNSIVPADGQNPEQVKIEKFTVVDERLSTAAVTLKSIEVENPLKDFLRIKNVENAAGFALYNTEGRMVLASKNPNYMSTANLLRGNYILKIDMKDGTVFSKKLIKN